MLPSVFMKEICSNPGNDYDNLLKSRRKISSWEKCRYSKCAQVNKPDFKLLFPGKLEDFSVCSRD